MSTIVAFLIVHPVDCSGTVYRGECSEGCEWEQLCVEAQFEPPPESTVREAIHLARMAALFKAREVLA